MIRRASKSTPTKPPVEISAAAKIAMARITSKTTKTMNSAK